ncbi:MAG TPA: cyclic nucleotide-binding domain-containing protein [Burkholderiales bacterium]|nr:cyclic nucleotide-binding domain-containing protein [Burkholderiales bacterium]
MADANKHGLALLDHLEHLRGDPRLAEQIMATVGRSAFFTEFTPADIEVLVGFMHGYRAQPGQTLIYEGDGGDFMLLLIQGQVDILKKNQRGEQQFMTTVGSGTTLGEMSMIDGEPRFATCVAREPTTFAALTREAMVNIILEQPGLGSKILIKLVTLLSQRLRQTSARLLQYMERPQDF